MDFISPYPFSNKRSKHSIPINSLNSQTSENSEEINDIFKQDLSNSSATKSKDNPMQLQNKNYSQKSTTLIENRNITKLRIRCVIYLVFVLFFWALTASLDEYLLHLSLSVVNNYSLNKNDIFSHIMIIIKVFCNNKFFILLFFMVYMFKPLSYSFTFMSSLVTTQYINSILYLIYGIDRKESSSDLENFFRNGSEKPNEFVMYSLVGYLGLLDITTTRPSNIILIQNSKEYKRNIFIIRLIIICIIILNFILQILYEGHSIKSCIYGFLFGFTIYVIIYDFFCLHHMRSVIFLRKIKKGFTYYLILYFIFRIIVYCVFNNYTKIYELKDSYAMKKKKKFDQKDFNKIALLDSVISVFLISGITGIYKVQRFFWNKSIIMNDNNNYTTIKLNSTRTYNKKTRKNNLLILSERNIIFFNEKKNPYEILIKNFYYCIVGLITYFVMEVIEDIQMSNDKPKIPMPFYVYILKYFIFYLNLGYVFFGHGIIQIIKKNFEEVKNGSKEMNEAKTSKDKDQGLSEEMLDSSPMEENYGDEYSENDDNSKEDYKDKRNENYNLDYNNLNKYNFREENFNNNNYIYEKPMKNYNNNNDN